METVLKTAPLKEPVTLDEVKRHLRIALEDTQHDIYLTDLILTARRKAESLCWRRFITQTWYAYYPDWPKGDYIQLPFGSLQSVTAVKYTDVDNSETTWSSAEYIVGTDYLKGRITLEDGYTWPNENLYPSNPIEVEFVCGYGDAATDVPNEIRQAMLIMIAEMFENREHTIMGFSVHKFDTVENLLSDFRLNEL